MTQHKKDHQREDSANASGADVPRLPAEDVADTTTSDVEKGIGGDRSRRDVADERTRREAPQPDHSERAGGDDQDIDTAGMVPGDKATDNKTPTGA